MAEAPKKSKGAKHKATYATDKRKGGYLIRVAGPDSNAFAGKEVPVTTKDGNEHLEKLDKVIWTGKDKESGIPVTLYTFVAKPKEKVDAEW